MTRPLLFLDVDGVLNPYAATACPHGFVEYDIFAGEEPVRVSAAHGEWLAELIPLADLVWATGWNDHANEYLSPLLVLPKLPVVRMPPIRFDPSAKVARIAAYAGQRPAVWIDDLHTLEAHAWARDRDVPTLLVTADPAIGLTRVHVDHVRDWVRSLPGS